MTDARWDDVFAHAKDAAGYFDGAVRLWGMIDVASEDRFARLRDEMALMHFMQCGHTSVEAALVSILEILDEQPPAKNDTWHVDLLNRIGREMSGQHARPAIVGADMLADLQETRRFRHMATRSYGRFDIARAEPSMAAARRVGEDLERLLRDFQVRMDPSDDHVSRPR